MRTHGTFGVPGSGHTMCGKPQARWSKTIDALVRCGSQHTFAVTDRTHEPITYRNSDVTCPLCLSAIRDRIRSLQAALPAEVAPPDLQGCASSNCDVAKRGGMSTSGGCHCSERDLRGAVRAWRRYAADLEARMPPSETKTVGERGTSDSE
jgi:hypothetical protein